ncbi:MAG: hypothetical protein HY905_15915 [Deltaproteobacteria bacterium]|nr:hypothetical protein [Deltaproteobacteria bacterium]
MSVTSQMFSWPMRAAGWASRQLPVENLARLEHLGPLPNSVIASPSLRPTPGNDDGTGLPVQPRLTICALLAAMDGEGWNWTSPGGPT